MGEQPGPVEEELERALVSMRVGFLSGSSQIATDVAALDEALADAPDNERERVRAAVTQIVNTQARLTAKMESLPAAAWDRFKIMVSVVKAQQIVLDQLGDLMQTHVLPRQIDNLSITPLPAVAPPAFPDDDPQPFPDDLPPSAFGEPFPGDPPPAYAPAAPRSESFMRAQQGLQSLDAQRAHDKRRGRRTSEAEDDDDPRSFLARARDRTAGYRGLVTMIAAAVVLALVPGEARHRLQDFAARVAAFVTPAAETRSSGEARAEADAPPSARTPASPSAETAVPRPAETAPRATEVAARPQERAAPSAVVPGAPASPAHKPSTKLAPAPAPAPVEVAAATPQAAPRADPGPVPAAAAPVSGLQPDERQTGPSVADDEPPAQPAGETQGIASASPAEEQFVPVVFTHKNYDTVMQAMTDLKQRFPNILIGRKGEVQPVDLGKKGVWHRLVFLPAVPRPEATRLCDQLMAKGYDRCWVKEY